MSRVSILITNYNGIDNLRLCLPGVLKAAAHGDLVDEVLIVDDCSSDGSVAYLAEHHPQVKVVALTERSSFLGAANAGFAAAKNRLVALLSSDMVPAEDFLAPLLPHFRDPDVFAVSTALRGPGGDLESGRTIGLFAFGTMFQLNSAKAYRPFGVFVRGRDDVPAPSFFTGGNALYDREKFQELGGFDKLYHPFYWEDTDLCFRAWKRGWRIVNEPAAVVVHHQKMGAIKKNFDRDYIREIRTRNRFLFLWKNLTDPLYWAEHALFIALVVPFAWLAGNLRFYRALAGAFGRLDQVRERRRTALPHPRGDREILKAVRDEPVGARQPALSSQDSSAL
jgi:GT2 family glycosyltransferase